MSNAEGQKIEYKDQLYEDDVQIGEKNYFEPQNRRRIRYLHL